ncbi:uncharacterized protein LOC124700338 isoform X1 [Lolium rigidum]|uniref:uncharacterized protein LOC124700338 isoform X1 n=1 Tax=Lolium rigidum TaxID=89674 RepID=UPI001F5D643F|nr:uncharacterized protein LOC124700338 isoform X1 [Lolium rigidum]
MSDSQLGLGFGCDYDRSTVTEFDFFLNNSFRILFLLFFLFQLNMALSQPRYPQPRILLGDRGAIQNFYFERCFQVTQTTDSCLLPLICVSWDMRIVPFCCGIGHMNQASGAMVVCNCFCFMLLSAA